MVVYLGGVVKNFVFHKPKKVSPARFIQRSIYYLMMQLLRNQGPNFSSKELDEIELVAKFC